MRSGRYDRGGGVGGVLFSTCCCVGRQAAAWSHVLLERPLTCYADVCARPVPVPNGSLCPPTSLHIGSVSLPVALKSALFHWLQALLAKRVVAAHLHLLAV